MGLPDLMKEIVSDKPSKDAFQAINSLKNDPSLLINQFSPEMVQDIKDNVTGKIKQTRPIFDAIWDNMKESKIIQDFMVNSYINLFYNGLEGRQINNRIIRSKINNFDTNKITKLVQRLSILYKYFLIQNHKERKNQNASEI